MAFEKTGENRRKQEKTRELKTRIKISVDIMKIRCYNHSRTLIKGEKSFKS